MSSNISSAASEVDVNVWRAIVGAAVKIPPLNAYVYYFPQGHLQQSSCSDHPINYNFTLLRPWIPCQVLSLNFLAKHSSDQPFAKFLLRPLQPLRPRPRTNNNNNNDDDNNTDVVSFVKILTRSDANRGGGFPMPRHCADLILPQLNYRANPALQNLVMRDVHNTAWEFRHVYRGTPRRHMLTKGWDRFVIDKRLVAGDSVVFMKKRSTNELFIGIRRARRVGGGGGEALAAMEMAARGRPFEVVYYPGIGVPEFVVEAEKAKEAIRRRWSPGMRVRMGVEMNDTWRMTWIQGVVSGVVMPIRGMWCGSPWRMLQVNWDEPETTQLVSPWQVQDITLTPPIDPHHHPSKRLRALQCSEILQPKEERALPLTRPIATQSTIQGARLFSVCSTPANRNFHPHAVDELKLAENSYPGILSPANHNSVQSNAAARCSSSFQLFGKTIKVSRPRDGCTSQNGDVQMEGRNVHI